MKLSQILFVAAAIAAVLSIASCKLNEDDEGALSEKIEYTNKSTKNYRAFKATVQKHLGGDAVISIDNATTVKGPTGNAVYGFVFGLEEVKYANIPVAAVQNADKLYIERVKMDKNGGEETVMEELKFYTFGIAAIRWNNNTKKAQCYVSWVENVPSSVFGFNTSGDFANIAVTAYADKKKTSPVSFTIGSEIQILPTIGTFEEIPISLDGTALKTSINVKAENDGSYIINFKDAAGTPLKLAQISKNTTKLTKPTQKLIGRYITVYAGETTEGSIKYSNVVKSAFADEEDLYGIIYE